MWASKKYGHAVKNEDDISKFYTATAPPFLLKAMLEVPRSAVRAYKTAFVHVQKWWIFVRENRPFACESPPFLIAAICCLHNPAAVRLRRPITNIWHRQQPASPPPFSCKGFICPIVIMGPSSSILAPLHFIVISVCHARNSPWKKNNFYYWPFVQKKKTQSFTLSLYHHHHHPSHTHHHVSDEIITLSLNIQ